MSGAFPLGPGWNPQWLPGYVPPAAEWNQAWSKKIDVDDPSLLGGPFLPLTGGVMEGQITLAGPPLQANDACTKAYADSLSIEAGPFMPQTGGTFTGLVTLAAAFPPVGPNDATPKSYVDQVMSVANNATSIANGAVTVANNAVPRSGGVMTGYLTLAGDPPSPMMAATKQYVDNNFVTYGGGTINTVNVGGNGVNYTNFSGPHRFAFNWDGSFILGYVDGTYVGQLASTAWVNGNFATIGYVNGTFYSAAASDGRYLFKTGDTCTGSFYVNGNIGCANSISASGNIIASGNIQGYGTVLGGALNIAGPGSVGSTFAIGSHGSIGAEGFYYSGVGNNYGFAFWFSSPWLYCRLGASFDIAVANACDERLKQDIEPAQVDCLSLVRRMPLHQFRMRRLGTRGAAIDDPGEQGQVFDAEPDAKLIPLGFVAQRMQEVFPEAVIGEKTLTVDLHAMVAALFGAVQTLADRLDAFAGAAKEA